MIVRVYLSESEHDDALIVGLKPLTVSGRFQSTIHPSIGRETPHSFVATMTKKWYDLFFKWIARDGRAGKLRDFRKCDLTESDDDIKQTFCKTCQGLKKLIVNGKKINPVDWQKHGMASDIGCVCH